MIAMSFWSMFLQAHVLSSLNGGGYVAASGPYVKSNFHNFPYNLRVMGVMIYLNYIFNIKLSVNVLFHIYSFCKVDDLFNFIM